ncbi:MAG: protein kinase [Candidatus Sericytochromatia bacterium]
MESDLPPADDWIELTQLEDLLPAQLEDATSPLLPPAPERYAFMGSVGKGAMGEVLLAQDVHLRRKVAYKKILPHMAVSQQVLSRFFAEAQITAQLDHPAIIPVYNLEVSPDGQIAYSMKLIQGKTLKELISEARELYQAGQMPTVNNQAQLSQDTLLRHFLKVCDALNFAHIKGVIHRDLKPANIMVGPYHEVYVMDWGIARIMGGAEARLDDEVVRLIHPDADAPPMERTQMGQIMGTPRYLSPEQAAGKNDLLDGRSDLFTLGLILFELVALKPAFTAKSQIELLKKILKAEKEPLEHVQKGLKIAPELVAIIHKATARRKDDRYADVAQMAEDLRRYLRGEAVLARPDSHLQKFRRYLAQHRQGALLGMALLIFLSLSGAAGLIALRSQAMLAARAQEQRLAVFLESVAERSRLLDRQFYLAEMALESMAALVTEALYQGELSPERFFLDRDYSQDPPEDYVLAPRYGKAISTAWPVFKLAPGSDFKTLQPQIRKLNRLRRDLGRLFVRGQLGNQPVPPPLQLRQKINQGEGTLLRWVFAGLKQGLMFAYPGKGGYPEDYDPRKRPWYRQSLNSRGLHWQKPYLDVQGQGLMLTCTRALYDYQGQFLGVAGAEMALKDILKLLPLPDARARKVYLLNQAMQIVAQQTQGQPAQAMVASAQDFPWTQALPAMRARNSGFVDLGQTRLVFYRLDILGWTYVVEADQSLKEPT